MWQSGHTRAESPNSSSGWNSFFLSRKNVSSKSFSGGNFAISQQKQMDVSMVIS